MPRSASRAAPASASPSRRARPPKGERAPAKNFAPASDFAPCREGSSLFDALCGPKYLFEPCSCMTRADHYLALREERTSNQFRLLSQFDPLRRPSLAQDVIFQRGKNHHFLTFERCLYSP